MSKGFLLFADGKDYVQQAALCAMSIKTSNTNASVSIVTNDKIPKKYELLFEHVIEIPWFEKTNSRFKTEHRWKLYHATPYDQTIVFDTDVLVFEDLKYFWKFVENYDLYFLTKSFTYRKEEVTSDFYRKAFTANNLPNVYSGMFYFKKSELAHEFYRWVELVTNNWELFYGQYCKEYYPKEPSMDVTHAIVMKILDIDNDVTNKTVDYPVFVHMKPKIQNWIQQPEHWQDYVGSYLSDDLIFKVGNHRQDTIFHYTENSFVTPEIIKTYENALK